MPPTDTPSDQPDHTEKRRARKRELSQATLDLRVGDPQEVIISGHSSTDLFDDDAVAGRRHGSNRRGRPSCAPYFMYRHTPAAPAHHFVDFLATTR